MATSLTVHIGARKTGTTFVQRALQARHAQLLEHGILYPTHYRPGNGDYNHVAAVYDVMREAGRSAGRWQDLALGTHQSLADEVNAHEGPAIISAEALSGLPLTDIRTFLAPFAGEIRVIATARDLGRVLPSSWQQHIRNTHTDSFSDWLIMRAEQRADGAATWESGDRYTFWRMFAYGELVKRWSAVVGDAQMHIVTAPERGAPTSVLWQRFCEAADLPSEFSEDVPVIPAVTANTGSTAAEAEFLLAFNERGRELNIDRRDLKRMQRETIALLLERSDRGAPLLLPESWLDEVREWARSDVSDLRRCAVKVHGDLAELEVKDSSAGLTAVSPQEVAEIGAYLAMEARRSQKADSGLRLARRFKRS